MYCPHSRLAARQPIDVVSVLAGPLKRRLYSLPNRLCSYSRLYNQLYRLYNQLRNWLYNQLRN